MYDSPELDEHRGNLPETTPAIHNATEGTVLAADDRDPESASLLDDSQTEDSRKSDDSNISTTALPTLLGPGKSQSPGKSSHCRGSWAWEIASEALSVVGLALLIVFLLYVDNSSYTKWKYHISPNTVISILAVVVKAALLVPVSSCISQAKWVGTPTELYQLQMLDQASRGPQGSVWLMFTRRPSLATLGCALTVLAIAIDPFAQQILSFPSRSTPSPAGTASIPRAQAYVSEKAWGNGLSTSMQMAVVNALFQEPVSLQPTCPSGDCTFPDFATMGFCSQCENISSQVEQSCSTPKSVLGGDWGVDIRNRIPECVYNAPYGFQFNSTNTYIAAEKVSPDLWRISRSGWNPMTNFDTASNTFKSTTMFGVESTLLQFFAASYIEPTYYSRENASQPEIPPEMTACVFYACEKQYTQNKVIGGKYSFDITKHQQLVIQSSSDSNTPWTLVTEASPYSGNATYTFDDTLLALAGMLAPFFEARGLGAAVSPPPMNRLNINTTFATLATSLTDNIRSANKASTAVLGKSHEIETYIHVRWPWVILPILVTTVSAILLALTAVVSRKQDLVLWKSSVLPLIIGRLQTHDEEGSPSLRNIQETELFAKGLKVLVEQCDDSIAFVEQQSEDTP